MTQLLPYYYPERDYWKNSKNDCFYVLNERTDFFKSSLEKRVVIDYKPKKILRAAIISVILLLIIVVMSFMLNNLIGVGVISHCHMTGLLIGIGLPLILLLGGGVILSYVIKKKVDLFTKKPLKNIFERSFCHVYMAKLTTFNDRTSSEKMWHLDTDNHYMADLSALDELQTGIAPVYQCFPKKTDAVHRGSICGIAIIIMPFVAIASMIYYLARAVIAPFYVLARLFQQLICKNSIKKHRKFELADVYKQFILSIQRVVKAPFYASAVMLAFFFSCIFPMEGRVLVSAVERDWNNDVSRGAGMWGGFMASRQFRWEGGGEDPDRLGRNGYYLLGCFQPFGLIYFENGEQISACSAGAIEGIEERNREGSIRVFINNN
ncbi:hypothetical protein [Candidatus Clavichlamydia salmonicola]|uniref:hypothetical protein n=1 Tax=Candidatus Clavichlamydia salmonicola TaxID=469812 RepID=UPI001891536F|nr:hypothetical protein [Candidatus Clavichlamydia salmonicola]